MTDLMIYLSYIVNSIISCLEIFIEYIWYIPLLGTNLGNLIFGLIIILMAFNLFKRWILGSYDDKPSKKQMKELEEIRSKRKERRNRQ